MATTTIHFSDSRQALGSCGNVFVTVLRQPMTIEAVEPLRRESFRMSERFAGKCVSLAIIEPTAASPASTEVRDATAAFARESNIMAAAIVIEGSGFRPAATRTLVAGMYLVTKKSYPHKIVATAEEGAVWLAEQLVAAGVPVSASEIVAAARATRAAIRGA
jgi:hypothetical protein